MQNPSNKRLTGSKGGKEMVTSSKAVLQRMGGPFPNIDSTGKRPRCKTRE